MQTIRGSLEVEMQVMRFPMLLDDAEIDKLFATFLQYVENTYELTLATDQFYPVRCRNGIYSTYALNLTKGKC